MNDPATLTQSTVETVQLEGIEREARGRNGWFRPQRVTVQRFEADRTVVITAESGRAYGDVAPIYMSVPLQDARLIHDALGRQLTALDATAAEE